MTSIVPPKWSFLCYAKSHVARPDSSIKNRWAPRFYFHKWKLLCTHVPNPFTLHSLSGVPRPPPRSPLSSENPPSRTWDTVVVPRVRAGLEEKILCWAPAIYSFSPGKHFLRALLAAPFYPFLSQYLGKLEWWLPPRGENIIPFAQQLILVNTLALF